MTGAKPASHGVMMNYDTRLDLPTLAGEVSKAGYHTHLVGFKRPGNTGTQQKELLKR